MAPTPPMSILCKGEFREMQSQVATCHMRRRNPSPPFCTRGLLIAFGGGGRDSGPPLLCVVYCAVLEQNGEFSRSDAKQVRPGATNHAGPIP